MGYARAGRGRDQTGHARIAEQVEHPHARALPDGGLLPFPVGGLLGEEGEVAETGEAAVEADIAPGQGPLLGRLARKRPAAFILVAGGIEDGVGLVPKRWVFRLPPALRLRPDDEVVAVALELLAVP